MKHKSLISQVISDEVLEKLYLWCCKSREHFPDLVLIVLAICLRTLFYFMPTWWFPKITYIMILDNIFKHCNPFME